MKAKAAEPKVVQYIASEAARRYGPIEPRLAEKLQRNIRRNFRVTVDRAEIQQQAEHLSLIHISEPTRPY